jgi:hypothetical protein
VDLIDVRCLSTEHPHRGSHHATRTLEDGTFVTVFWNTPRTPDADTRLDQAAHTSIPKRMPPRLRTRQDYARALVQQ